MQVEVLKEFIVVANQRNIRKAADELHLTRSALSKHISALEREIGFPLLDRSGGLALTPEGECFYVYAQRMLDVLDEGLAKCAEISKKSAPAVRVQWSGQESRIFEGMLSQIKTPVNLVSPKTDVDIFESLASGYADAIFTYGVDTVPALAQKIEEEQLICTLIGDEPVSILMSRDNPLSAKGSLSREDLRDAKIMTGYGSLFEHVVGSLEQLVGEGSNARVVQDPALDDIRDLLFLDPGQMILFHFSDVVHHVCSFRNDVVAFDELDGRPITYRTFMVYRADAQNPNVHAFVAEVEALVAAQQENEETNKDTPQDS